MDIQYDKNYFENGTKTGVSNYNGYEDSPHYKQLANYIKEKISGYGGKVLEVGCAKGYIVKYLRDIGVDAYGYDISEYAVSVSPVKEYLKSGSIVKMPFKDKEFEWVYSFDTLEHLHPEEVERAVAELTRISNRQFHSITTPEYSVGEDKTHYSMFPIQWWKDKFPLNAIIKHAGEN